VKEKGKMEEEEEERSDDARGGARVSSGRKRCIPSTSSMGLSLPGE
jgi:hypothetical protein